jgi:transcriptional regulator with GAF, ATPase, and Fis domain
MLRVIQEKQLTRIGGETVFGQCQDICATNKIVGGGAGGKLRQDLTSA